MNVTHIRSATSPTDRQHAADLFESAGWNWIPDDSADEVTMLAEHADTPVGAINGRTDAGLFPEDSIYEHIDTRRAWLDFLAVEPGMRRHGLGRALVHAFVTVAHQCGCTHVGLTVAPGHGLSQRIAFFEACGMMDLSVVGGSYSHMGGVVTDIYESTSAHAGTS